MILPDCMMPDGAEPCRAFHELAEALRLIASFHGKTLIDFPQCSRTYSEGAYAAFEQCADIAIRALQR